MSYDQKLPVALKNVQTWFGAIIQQKMTNDYEIQPRSHTGATISGEASQYITGSSDFPAHERLQLYNQSYWFRLLDALHEEFPTVVRLFGEQEFNRVFGVCYLDYAPPRHWSLNVLGDRFVDWIKVNYNFPDKQLVVTCAELDWVCQDIFFKKRLPSINKAYYSGPAASKLLTTELCLQPTVYLFTCSGHFMQFRKELLEYSAEYWQENDFPKLIKDRDNYFILYRNQELTVEWKELCREEYLFLYLISRHGTIEAALYAIQDLADINYDLLEKNISIWAERWISLDWLTKRIEK